MAVFTFAENNVFNEQSPIIARNQPNAEPTVSTTISSQRVENQPTEPSMPSELLSLLQSVDTSHLDAELNIESMDDNNGGRIIFTEDEIRESFADMEF